MLQRHTHATSVATQMSQECDEHINQGGAVKLECSEFTEGILKTINAKKQKLYFNFIHKKQKHEWL